MVDHQNLFALGGSLDSDPSNLDGDYWDIGRFEDMPFEELDRLIEDQHEQRSIELPFESPDPSSQNAPPHSSLSPGDTDPQYTPSSTAYDLPSDESNLDGFPIDFISEDMNSPNEAFEQISPYSSRSSDYSHVSQSIPRSVSGASPLAHRSRESTGGLVADMAQQQWPSFDTLASDIDNQPVTSQYHSFADTTAISAGAMTNPALFGAALPLRTAQTNQAWVSTSLQSSTYGNRWGDFHEQPMFFQQGTLTQVVPQYVQAPQQGHLIQAPMQNALSLHMVPSSSNDLLDGTPQQPLPLQAYHGARRQYELGVQVPEKPRIQTYTARQSLAHSTRRRFPDHPAIAAEQKNATSPSHNHRQLAVAHPEDIPVTARPRVPQDEKPKQGGRKKNSHLNQDARDRSSKMRKKGACWRCKLQRDPVSVRRSCYRDL